MAPTETHDPPKQPDNANRHVARRRFLQGSTLSVAGVVIAGCGSGSKSASTSTPAPTQAAPPAAKKADVTIDFADGDTAIVNFAYALEQLEAAFYAKVNASPASGLTKEGRSTLADIGAHEIAHRDFLKAVLGKDAIPALEVDFSMIDFSNAKTVLTTAQTFEDLGVSAYNGAAQFLDGKGALGLAPLQAAGEIVSVEARHASAIRTLLNGPSSGAFAPDAFDKATLPMAVLEAAAPFIKTKVALANAPTSAKS